MTDSELIKAAAERVMNWVYGYPREWNPLTSDDHAFMLVDKMGEDGWLFALLRQTSETGPADWFVRLRRWGSPDNLSTNDPDRRRAIVIAALKACGVDV